MQKSPFMVEIIIDLTHGRKLDGHEHKQGLGWWIFQAYVTQKLIVLLAELCSSFKTKRKSE
jgi:hypothetical protein